MDKNACGMMKVNSMFELTANEKLVVLVSRGNDSLGIKQPIGPHDHTRLITYRQTSNTTAIISPCLNEFLAFKYASRIPPIIVCIT
ncbi:hypothetical protein BVC80_8955g48 [Macleaya cordata]|uniref:Uncharacterized protein n=1 Tax=Macleaya cordata TaxID=56857 RepID=A0A200QWN6_MACCD|nr:hypothetical protein BVC80_8955g48 [Macleaya cordata]